MASTSILPKAFQPMLATLTDAPFDDPDWVFETKWDGFRLIATVEKRSVTLYSRNGEVVSARYKLIAEALAQVGTDCVIDGELVASISVASHTSNSCRTLCEARRTSTTACSI